MSVAVQHRRDTNANVEANIPLAGEFWMDTTKAELTIGNGTLAGGIRQQKKNTSEIVVAAQIVANTNDYSPASLKHAGVLLVSTDASRDITGLVAVGVTDSLDGREITIYNNGAFNAVLRDQSVASGAANRFDLGGTDVTLGPKQSITLRYRTQGALNRWEVKASTAGAAVADGSISTRKLAGSALGPRTGLLNGTLVESHAAGAVTYAIKTLAGTDPTALDPVFASFYNGAGAYVVRTITAALSFTISSGSAMGVAVNNAAFRLWFPLIDNAGVVELAAVNCSDTSGVMALNEGLTYSTTAEGGAGAADAIKTIYSATARASKYICLAGYADYDAGLAAVGTWSASPTRIIPYGPATPRPGDPVQTVVSQSGSVATGTTIIPFDDTIPQSTEGDQYMSCTMTPAAAQNILDVETMVQITTSAAAATLMAALFRDAGAGAIAVGSGSTGGIGFQTQIQIVTKVAAVAAVSTTFKARGGYGAAGTTTFNGSAGARLFGGTYNSFLRVREIMG